MYKSDTSIEGQSKTANVEELLDSVKTYIEERHNEDFEEMQADGTIGEGVELSEADLPTVTLSDYLENISLLSAVDMESDEDSVNRIALMTVHSSKGLEFPYVYIAGLEENLFPSGGSMASEHDIEEERRLFYVAVTRAEKAVDLTFASTRMRNGKHESNPPSRFIMEIDRKYIANPLQSAQDGLEESAAPAFWGRRADCSAAGLPLFHSLLQPLHALHDALVTAGVGDADEALALGAEGGAGHRGDVGFL